ncbi:hypothetical protein [Solihabitans fulvus]|nr:hypothetical protein [Solihabitans fulvus]
MRPARENTSDPAPSPAERALLRVRQWIESVRGVLAGTSWAQLSGRGR